MIVAAAGEELPGDTVRGVGDGPGVYVIVRTIPEDEPLPGAVYVNTTTEGDWLLDAVKDPPGEPLGELVGVTPELLVVDADCWPLPGPDEPYGVTWGPDDGAPCDPPADGVMVRTVVNPEGSPGPGGTVYVTTSTDAVEEAAFPDEPEPAADEAPTEDPRTVTVRGCGDAPAPEEPYVEPVWEPPDGPLCVPGPVMVRVSTPVDPEERPGPGGTVYVRTSTVGFEEAAEAG